MRIATWNVNSITARLPRLLEWLEATAPDAVALQETKIADAAFPTAEVEALGYQVAAHGDGRWNGVALLSKVGLDDVARGLQDEPGFPAVEARAVGATCGGVRLWSVYVPNGREPGHEHYAYKLAWLAALRTTLAADLPTATDLAVMGDFNVAPTDDDVFDRAAFEGSTHVTEPERAAVRALLDDGLVDVVPAAGEVRLSLHLLGLPGRHVPQEPRHAHRPGLCHAVRGWRGQRRVRRPRRPQGQGPVRPRARRGRPRPELRT